MRGEQRRRLWSLATLPDPGRPAYEVIHRRGGAALRYYSPAGSHSPYAPLVLVPPPGTAIRTGWRGEAGRVAYFSARGFDVYWIDWGEIAHADDRRHLADYFAALLPEMLARVQFHAGRGRLSLYGWRLGGLFTLCCAALSSPASIARVALEDVRIDYHAPLPHAARENALRHGLAAWRRVSGLRAADLPPACLHLPGWLEQMARGVEAGHPGGAAREALRFRRVLPAGVIADLVDFLWLDNALAAGRLPMVGAKASLSALRVPVLYLVDAERGGCTSRCAQRLAAVVSEVVSERIHSDGPGADRLDARAAGVRVADWLTAAR